MYGSEHYGYADRHYGGHGGHGGHGGYGGHGGHYIRNPMDGPNAIIHRAPAPTDPEDGSKKMVVRRTVDLGSPYLQMFKSRFSVRDYREVGWIQSNLAGSLDMPAPVAVPHLACSGYANKYVHTSNNKVRCSINQTVWTPDGRRCITGTQSGEFTLWNGTSFTFETILQAHDCAVRCMRFSHSGWWLLSTDDAGKVQIWKTNLELVMAKHAHKEACRAVSFSPTDLKFSTCSDDSTVKVWDFARCETELTLTGHGGDVRYTEWHPTKGMIASCSRDGLAKLWDARAGKCLATLHGHKNTVMQARWNQNGNWLLTVGRDALCMLFDIRTQQQLSTFKGHTKEVCAAAWHPFHEDMFVSGGHDGSMMFWLASQGEAPQAEVPGAHDAAIWTLSWHPVGHVLATGSGDFCTKFWCRARPGDVWRDRHQREQEEAAADADDAAAAVIASMAQPAADPATTRQVIPGIGDVAEQASEPSKPLLGFLSSDVGSKGWGGGSKAGSKRSWAEAGGDFDIQGFHLKDHSQSDGQSYHTRHVHFRPRPPGITPPQPPPGPPPMGHPPPPRPPSGPPPPHPPPMGPGMPHMGPLPGMMFPGGMPGEYPPSFHQGLPPPGLGPPFPPQDMPPGQRDHRRNRKPGDKKMNQKRNKKRTG